MATEIYELQRVLGTYSAERLELDASTKYEKSESFCSKLAVWVYAQYIELITQILPVKTEF